MAAKWAWRELEIDGQLRQHMFAPQLFEGERTQGRAVGVLEETHLVGRFVVARTERSGGAGHALGIFELDIDSGRFTLRRDDAHDRVEGGAVRQEAGLAAPG